MVDNFAVTQLPQLILLLYILLERQFEVALELLHIGLEHLHKFFMDLLPRILTVFEEHDTDFLLGLLNDLIV